MQAVMTKAGVFDNEVTANINQYNVPAVVRLTPVTRASITARGVCISRQHGSRSVADRLSHGVGSGLVSVPLA